jgi:hypothetical protein
MGIIHSLLIQLLEARTAVSTSYFGKVSNDVRKCREEHLEMHLPQ